MSLRKALRVVVGLGLCLTAFLLGLTILPSTTEPGASWQPFMVLTALLIGGVLAAGWLVARAGAF